MNPAPAVPLKDVEWRLDSEPREGRSGTRARFVPHINARIAAALMDEWVGPTNWSDEYRTVTIGGKEALLCTVSVFAATAGVENYKWVSKQDVGVPSNTEPQKGAVSDAFKRVVTVKWGAGRNVYDLPTLWAPCDAKSGRDGKVRGFANDKTLPDLLAQLKRLGFEDAAGKLEDDERPSDENAEAEKDVGDTRAPSPAPEATHATRPASSEPASAIGKNQMQQAKARVRALQAAKVSIADERAKRLLPPLNDEISDDEFALWLVMLDELEAAHA